MVMNMTIKDLICMATGKVFLVLSKHHSTITNGEAFLSMPLGGKCSASCSSCFTPLGMQCLVPTE